MPEDLDHWKRYAPIDDIVGNEGEGAGSFAFVANLSPDQNYPECRIVVGSPPTSAIDLGQFGLTYDKAGEMIERLREIRLDMELAGAVPAANRLALEQAIHDLRKSIKCLALEVNESIHTYIAGQLDTLINLITGRK